MPFEQFVTQYLIPIGGAFLLAWIVHRLGKRIVAVLMRITGYAPRTLRLRAERQRTLRDLLASMVSFVAFLLAGLFTLSTFVDLNTLVWMVGLFSAAFGLGARPLISDWLTGIGYLFEDTFDVGDKVEVLGIEGVIEALNLRTTFLRAPSGELFIIPNGEIRVIRNFSRGTFSTARVKVRVTASDLDQAMQLLRDLGAESVIQMADLLEPWQVIVSDELDQQVELTLIVKARFGKAADLRPQVLSLVQRKLAEAGIGAAQQP
ncbi:MAG: hypothetical protein Kow0077_20300 [Anaerolineae bacterium]